MKMDSGVIIMLIALFVMMTSVFIVLMLIMPEWFGISKKTETEPSEKSRHIDSNTNSSS